MLRFRWSLFLMLFIGLFVSQSDANAQSTEDEHENWWQGRVFYEIFVRSFYDSDGDGIGDIRGIIQQLDYLESLGITGLWLMPISPSPSYHGYDVTDYRAINPDYGTMDDFRELLAEAHARGIAVIIDLVINHTSVNHPWFIESASSPDNAYRDWYIWADENPNFRGPDNQVVWHQRGGAYYYGVFWDGMPDLNYANPDVTAEMYDIARFWLEDVGVDGFRLDAIKHIIEEGNIQENTPATRQWMADFRDYIQSIRPDALLVGEVWSSSYNVAPYTDNAVDILFEFDLASNIISASSLAIAQSIYNPMNIILDLYPDQFYATFITNHDQNRVMSQLRGNVDYAKTAASILLTLPGVPFIYYGEEIGMTGTKPDPDIRTPMQWDDSAPNVGFTTGQPWAAINADWQEGITVSAQDDNADSLLNHYRTLIHLRNTIPSLRYGSYLPADGGTGTVLSFIRQTENQTVLVVINMRAREIENYGITLESGVLDTTGNVRVLFGTDEAITQPDFVEGGFTDYKPLDVLPPLSVLVIELP